MAALPQGSRPSMAAWPAAGSAPRASPTSLPPRASWLGKSPRCQGSGGAGVGNRPPRVKGPYAYASQNSSLKLSPSPLHGPVQLSQASHQWSALDLVCSIL